MTTQLIVTDVKGNHKCTKCHEQRKVQRIYFAQTADNKLYTPIYNGHYCMFCSAGIKFDIAERLKNL